MSTHTSSALQTKTIAAILRVFSSRSQSTATSTGPSPTVALPRRGPTRVPPSLLLLMWPRQRLKLRARLRSTRASGSSRIWTSWSRPSWRRSRRWFWSSTLRTRASAARLSTKRSARAQAAQPRHAAPSSCAAKPLCSSTQATLCARRCLHCWPISCRRCRRATKPRRSRLCDA
eukprot:Amastigsp_a687933_5.p3 type:complete len:174 gc:universal Amastigsp_a687933_5:176-697(+)